MNKIIAITGMCGTGKSVATEFLENRGYYKFYFGGITYKKMQEAGIERTPESEKEFRENLRKEHGEECYAKLLYPEIKEAVKTRNIVLDGLYSWAEYKYLKEKFPDNLILIAVITNKNIRYKRVALREERPYNLEEVTARDMSELENLSKGGPIAFSDYFIFNNGTIEEHKKQLKDILQEIEE